MQTTIVSTPQVRIDARERLLTLRDIEIIDAVEARYDLAEVALLQTWEGPPRALALTINEKKDNGGFVDSTFVVMAAQPIEEILSLIEIGTRTNSGFRTKA